MRRTVSYFLPAALLFLVATFPIAAVSGPGKEDALRLLTPCRLGGEAAPGWILESIETHPEFIRFLFSFAGLEDGHQCWSVFEVTARSASHPGLIPLRRYSLFLIRNSCLTEPVELIRWVAQRISSNESAGPLLLSPQGEASVHVSGILSGAFTKSLRLPHVICLVFFLTGLLLSALSLRHRHVRRGLFSTEKPEPHRAAWLPVILSLLTASFVRFLDSPHTIANANSHAYNWIRTAIYGIGNEDWTGK